MSEEAPDCCRRSFAASIKDTAKRLLEDPMIAPRRVASKRMIICEQCEHFLPMTGQCDICQCFMRLKTTMANMRCPLDKWEEWTRAN
jgi:proline racemase